jgi:hypothetical protein
MTHEISLQMRDRRKLSVLAINDVTDTRGTCIGNVGGMCCNSHVMDQQEIIKKTQDSYSQVY